MPRMNFRPLDVIHRVVLTALALVTLALVGPSKSWASRRVAIISTCGPWM
jgi:hypothetical protein